MRIKWRPQLHFHSSVIFQRNRWQVLCLVPILTIYSVFLRFVWKIWKLFLLARGDFKSGWTTSAMWPYSSMPFLRGHTYRRTGSLFSLAEGSCCRKTGNVPSRLPVCHRLCLRQEIKWPRWHTASEKPWANWMNERNCQETKHVKSKSVRVAMTLA